LLAERITCRVVLVLLALFLTPVETVLADEAPADILRAGIWRVDTPLGSVTGPCLYLVDGADCTNWRCEIAVAESGVWPTRDDLLERRGYGWTMTGSVDGGFIQPWHEPWRQLGHSATLSMADLLRWWSGGSGRQDAGVDGGNSHYRWRPRRSGSPVSVIFDDWSGLPETWRPPTTGARAGGSLRRQLTTRGTGRGGDGLVLDLSWEDERLAVTSARWPGRLIIEKGADEWTAVPEEAFLPLWPLAEFLP